MSDPEKIGIVLINTGSPDAPGVSETRRYLRQFLSDPRVIDIAPIKRWLLLNLVILPFRPKVSSHAYRQVWTDQGSPLIVNSLAFRDRLRETLPNACIEIGMAYGSPSISDAMDCLSDQGVDRIVIVPMFPQYASATTGSVLEGAYMAASRKLNVPMLSALPPYYADAGYLDAWAEVARPELDAFAPDHVLLSFHGLPERQIRKCDPTGTHCLSKPDCCDRYLDANPNCYRAHCFATSRGIAERLALQENAYTIAFQSKLGRDPWLSPAADERVRELARGGVKRLAVLSPAFVADCLETLEEIGIRAKDDFLKHGGEDFLLVPSLNIHPAWVDAMTRILERHLGKGAALS